MTRPEIEETLREIIKEQLAITDDEIDVSSTFSKLGADSLDVVEIIMMIEDKFSISIADTEVEKINTFDELIDFTATKIAQGTN